MRTKLKHPYNLFFGTLANQTRLDVMSVLLDGPVNVTVLCTKTGHQQPTISKNLKRLAHCGFVFCTKKGKERVYALNGTTIKPLLQMMKKHMGQYCSKINGHELKEALKHAS